MGMCGHESHADEGLVARHSGGDDGRDEDAVFEEVVGDGESLGIVADKEGDDGGGGVANLKTQILEGFEGVALVVPEGGIAFGFAAHDVERFEHRSSAGGSDGGGEDVGADGVFHPVDGLLVGGDETAHGGEALGEGAHDEFHILELAEMVAGAAAFTAENAETVGLVDHKGGVVFVADVDHLVDMGHVAFHGENTVGDDELGSLEGCFLQHALKVGHVVMFVFLGVGVGNEFAFHDGGMDALVVEEVVAAGDDVGDDAAVGEEAGGEEHDVVLAKEFSQFVLQLDMDVEGTVEERRAGATGAVLVNGTFGGFFQTRVVGESEIGIGTEHKNLTLTSLHVDFGVLFGSDGSEIRINPCSFGFLRGGVLS